MTDSGSGFESSGPIITPDRRVRVFVSSTLDLSEERTAARQAIEALRMAPVMFEAGARAHPPRTLYRAYLAQSDVFVGIYARRYGWTAPDMDISGVEDEFNLSSGLPRLVYIEHGAAREPELERFLERLHDAGLSYKPYRSAAELEQLVKADLMVLLTERFHSRVARPSPRASLPVPPGRLVGRDSERQDLAELLGRPDIRLVTLVGPGGIGKTRLAISAARAAEEEGQLNAYFIDLSQVTEPGNVASAIAEALHASTTDDAPAVQSINDRLRDERSLLVVDNFEQVTSAAPTIVDILSACPGVTALVTSRAPLRVLGEHEYPVPPLAVPEATDQAILSPAVELFVSLTRDHRHQFDPGDNELATIAALCRKLDGLPLAIELAAGSARLLPPEAILRQLDAHLTDLGAARRDMPSRHQTVRDTIAWSYDLLDGPLREFFAQLGVFPATFTIDRVIEICPSGTDALVLLSALVEQSLVRVEHRQDGPAFSMLGTIKHFARERLDEHGTTDTLMQRHAQTFLALADRVGCPRGRHHDALDGFETELEDVRQALGWALDHDPGRAAAAMGESWWFWWLRGYVQEGRTWTERALHSPSLAPQHRMSASFAHAMFLLWSGRYADALDRFETTRQLAASLADQRHLAYADVGTGLITAVTRSMADGTEQIRSGIDTFEAVGDDVGVATGLAALTWVQALAREFEPSDDTLRHALDEARLRGSEIEVGLVEAALAQYHLTIGDEGAALQFLRSALDRLSRARHIGSTIMTLEVLAETAIDDDPHSAATLLGATSAIRASMGTVVPPSAEARTRHLVARAHAEISGTFEHAWSRGHDMTLAEASRFGDEILTERIAQSTQR